MSPHPSDLSRYSVFLAGLLLAMAIALVGFSVYERLVLGAIRLGTGDPPHFTAYYLLRLAIAVGLATLLVGGLYRLRGRPAAIDRYRLSSGQRRAAWAMLAAAVGALAIFVLRPRLFVALALEDGPVEWPSALLPLGSSAVFAWAFVTVLRSPRGARSRNLALAFCALFALGLFVVGMEEISWMQRIFHTGTPSVFLHNEQHEINLHNFHSLIFNITYRTAVFGGLVVVPFLAETLPENGVVKALRDFLPGRFVLAFSAPLAGFEYNGWNFVLGPLVLATAAAILIVYALAARARRDRAEARLFWLLASFVVLAPCVFLLHTVSETWTISEYRELLLAAGLAAYTVTVAGRIAGRYGHAAPGRLDRVGPTAAIDRP